MFTDEIRALLDAPRVGTLGTTNPDGSPLLTPIWFAREGDEIWLVIGPNSPKARNIRHDSRVMYVVMDESGYTYVTIQGRARLESGEDGAKPRAMAIRYLGEQAGARFAERDYIKEEIVCRITPEKVRLRRAE
ncbi:MAG: PPOX class F420-dependent oxidoreductase [Chloroflexota bacterium]|nr:PPOX class F420-dependent oxidoreductase [Chloroflexota bacterium]MDQ6907775.1 PPOX class F420-dependent oxidoreductase [Chloroflexota bacterium]